jgi:hypothetical protein
MVLLNFLRLDRYEFERRREMQSNLVDTNSLGKVSFVCCQCGLLQPVTYHFPHCNCLTFLRCKMRCEFGRRKLAS